jgi:hypothetical protein
MDDQWFIFEEDDVVHAHRSWTGIEMFAIRLRRLPDGSCEIVGVTVDDLCGYRIPLRRRFARFRPRRFHDADESALHILDTFFDSVSGVPTMATGLDVAVFGWNPTEFGYIPGEW